MARSSGWDYRGRLIRSRIGPQIHKQLRILVTRRETTAQNAIRNLIEREAKRLGAI